MSDLDDSLLRLRAKMILRRTEDNFRRCSEEEKRKGLSIRAYYLGCEYRQSEMNPFQDIQHPFHDDLVVSFSHGSGLQESTVLNQ